MSKLRTRKSGLDLQLSGPSHCRVFCKFLHACGSQFPHLWQRENNACPIDLPGWGVDLKRNRVSTLPVLGMVMKVMAVALLTRNAGAHLWFHSGLEEERRAVLETQGWLSHVAFGSHAESPSRGQTPPVSLFLFNKEKVPNQPPSGRQ